MALSGMVWEFLARFKDDGDAAAGAGWGDGISGAVDYKKSFTNGTGSGQANVGTVLTYTLASAATQLLVINDALLSEISGTLTMAKMIGFAILNDSITAGDYLRVECDASNGFATGFFGAAGDYFKVGPGGMAAFCNPIDGYACTNATDELLITNSGANAVTFRLLLLGRNA
jgi:hypothetical protein